MSNPPRRIYIWGEFDGDKRLGHGWEEAKKGDDNMTGDVAYVRADIVDELLETMDAIAVGLEETGFQFSAKVVRDMIATSNCEEK